MNESRDENEDDAVEHDFAPFVRIVGRGKRARRDFTREEARQSLAMILDGKATPAQTGAWLMLLRVKEETSEELAGFVEATRDWIDRHHRLPAADLDWPSYAGKKKHHPWYLLAALALAQQGHRVFMHGGAPHTHGRLYTENALQKLGVPVSRTVAEAGEHLQATSFCYLPLQVLCSPLDALLSLRFELGLRSPVNTLARCINPARAPASLQSVFHPSYNSLQQGAAALLHEPRLVLFKGEGGEIEVRPDADTRLFGLRDGAPLDTQWPAVLPRQAAPDVAPDVEPLRRLWRDENADAYGEQAVLQTLSVALFAMGKAPDLETSRELAGQYWASRDRTRLLIHSGPDGAGRNQS